MASLSTDGSAGSDAGPVFVVGSMRSGSTMLRLIIDSHPHIAIGAETGFVGGLAAAKEIPSWNFGKGWFERLGWSEAEIDERLREFYEGIFRRHARQQGKRRWGEKTPFHTSYMPLMAQVFPDAVFVGIVRHPGAVAASLRKRFHYTFPAAVAYWEATNVDMLRAGTALGARFALCRYEDLVLEGEPVLRELVDLLGEPWAPELLEHHRVQREKGAPRAAEGSTIAHAPIDAKRAVQWAEGSSEQDHRDLEAAAPLAAFFGYDPVDPVIRDDLLPVGAPRRWMPTGAELGGRVSAWAPPLDLRPRTAPVVVDASPQELAARLARAEQALARARSRRAVRAVDAFRKLQHGRSLADARAAWSIVRGPSRSGTR
ncbi:MAG TPA: sulfotransferase [Nocardioidaceae bacterium]